MLSYLYIQSIFEFLVETGIFELMFESNKAGG